MSAQNRPPVKDDGDILRPPTTTSAQRHATNAAKTSSSNASSIPPSSKTTTSVGSISNEFINPPEFKVDFPWKRIGSFIDSDNPPSIEELKLLTSESSTHKLSTYISEKYYSDLYWNCSLVIGNCFAAWVIAYFGFGIFSLIFVLTCTFTIYRSEFRRFNTNIRDDMQRVQSKESLQKRLESMHWLNDFLSKFWVIYMPALSELVVKQTNEVLTQVSPPAPINKLTLDEFTLGSKAPKVDSIKSFTKLDKNLYQMDWSFGFTPTDTDGMTKYELKKKIDPKVALGIRIGKGFVGASLPILVEDMSFTGDLRVTLKLGDNFPHIDVVSICFLDQPKIDYALKPVGGNTFGIDIMSVIPGLASFVNGLIHSNLAPMMYAPNTLDINVAEIMENSIPSAIGCLAVKIRGAEYLSEKSINPFIQFGPEFVPEKQFKTDIKSSTTVPVFNELKYMLIDNLSARLQFQLFDLKKDGKTNLLGESFFELQDLLQNSDFEMTERKLVKNNRNIGKVVHDLKWFPVLEGEVMSDGSKANPPESDTGVFEFTLISAENMDCSQSLIGKLSTFAEIYINGELVETSRLAKSSNHPEYKCKVEQLIRSKGTSPIKILIKDISSFEETTIAEYESPSLLDLIYITSENNKHVSFTKGKGSMRLTSVWKSLANIGMEDDISFIPPIGAFRINVLGCKGLPNLKTIGTIDPYVRIVSGGKVRGVTSVDENTLNPSFDEVFYVPILSKKQKITLDCMDVQSKGKKDRVVGSMNLNLDEFFKQESKQNTSMSTNGQLTMNGKPVGTIFFKLAYFPMVPVYSCREMKELTKSKDTSNEDELEDLEEQAKFLEDYKKHPDDYEWFEEDSVEVSKQADSGKVVISLDDLIKHNSGILGINILSGLLQTRSGYVQVLIDDREYPDFTSRMSHNKKLGSNAGEAFIRDLEHSVVTFRITKNERVLSKTDILAETETLIPVLELLKKSFDEPFEIKIGGNILKIMLEYVPSELSLNSSESVLDTGILDLEIIGCENLISADRNGKSDPFVKVILNNKTVYKTKTVKKTLNPVFDESKSIPIHSRSRSDFRLHVFDWDMAGDNDDLGEVQLNLASLPPDKKIVTELKLSIQGVIKLAFQFTPGYLKPNVGVVSRSSTVDPVGMVGNLGVNSLSGAAHLGNSVAGGAAGVATGAVGNVTGGLMKKFGGGNSRKSSETHRKSFGKNPDISSLHSNSDSNPNSNSNSNMPPLPNNSSSSQHLYKNLTGSSRLPQPASPRQNGNLSPNSNKSAFAAPLSPNGRSSMDAASLNTAAFGGAAAIPGRLTIISLSGAETKGLFVKVMMESSSGKSKELYKTKPMKPINSVVTWHESLGFKCEKAGKVLFIVKSHHTFGKDHDLAEGEILLEEASGVTNNIEINLTGEIKGKLIVNFNYGIQY